MNLEQTEQKAKKYVNDFTSILEGLPIEIYPKDLEQAYTDGYHECFNDVKEIIRNLCNAIRVLNNPNTQLTNVNEFLSEAEQLLKEEKDVHI